MNYRKVYITIIKKAITENRKRTVLRVVDEKGNIHRHRTGTYYEEHHILPKSLFPKWRKRKANKVLLTAREHYFCHQLLDKIYPGQKMFLALWRVSIDKSHKVSTREYERLKLRYSVFMSTQVAEKNKFYGRHHTDEYKKLKSDMMKGRYNGENNPFYGKKHTKETLDKMKLSSFPYKGILCLETKKIYKALDQIIEEFNLKSKGSLSNAIRYSMRAGGYHWVYLDFDDKVNEQKIKKLLDDIQKQKDAKPKVHPNSIPVVCIETGTKFNSAKEAAQFVNIHISSVSKAIKTKQKAGGYHWAFYQTQPKDN